MAPDTALVLKSMWPFMHSLVNVCTEYDPNERPTVSRILTELNEPGKRLQVEDQRRAIAPTPRDHDPTRILGIGSIVQVSDPPRYGVLRWIGELPDVNGATAGVEMVSLLLQTLHMCCSRDGFAGVVQEETIQGCTDGSWKGTRLFQCQPGRGFFCPLTTVRPDGRFTPVGETPRGVTALPNREILTL